LIGRINRAANVGCNFTLTGGYMAAKEYATWFLREKLKRGIAWRPTPKEAFNAALEIVESRKTATNKPSMPCCSKCGSSDGVRIEHFMCVNCGIYW
jgi:hypothetical protein